ncbi:MAG: hypothetical protein M3Q75_09530 [Gemmatimonadota bacterium]|nr:hypothetical protein [Gemmatimonadota bacterium]
MPELRDATVVLGVPGLNGTGLTGPEKTAITNDTTALKAATYITQTANATLSAEQPLSTLATGLVKVTTGTGVLSTAVAADLPVHTHTVTTSLAYSIGDGVTLISTGNKFGFRVGFAGTLTAKYIVSDVTTTTTVDVWASTTYPPAVGNTIAGGNKLIIQASTAQTSTAMTGWTTAFAANTWFFFNVDSNSAAKWLGISIDFTRTI